MKVPKQKVKLAHWLIFAILTNAVITVTYSAATTDRPEEGQESSDHDSHDHHEEETSHEHGVSNHEEHSHEHDEHNHELSVNHEEPLHDHQSAENTEVSIRNFGEDCAGEGVKCNDNSGLICAKDLGKCECASGFVFSSTSEKCEEGPPQPALDEHEHVEEAPPEHEHEEAPPESEPTTSTVPSAKIESEHSLDLQVNQRELEHHHDEEENVHESEEHKHDDHDHEQEHEHENGHEHTHALLGSKCENFHCDAVYGKYSKCDEETGECICHDTDELNRPVELVNEKCWIVKKINDSCTSHDECSAFIKGRAWCHMDLETKAEFCQCEAFHYFDDGLQECLKFADNGLFSACKTDFQCAGYESTPSGHGLGPNAKCSKEHGVCECKLRSDGQKGFMYENFCYYKLALDDPCIFSKECELSLPNNNVYCEKVTNTCQPVPVEIDGRKLESGDGSEEEGAINSLKSAIGIEMPNFVLIMIIVAVALLAVGILTVFVLKKRHKYTMVRTRESSHPNDI